MCRHHFKIKCVWTETRRAAQNRQHTREPGLNRTLSVALQRVIKRIRVTRSILQPSLKGVVTPWLAASCSLSLTHLNDRWSESAPITAERFWHSHTNKARTKEFSLSLMSTANLFWIHWCEPADRHQTRGPVQTHVWHQDLQNKAFSLLLHTSTEITHLLDKLISDIWKLFFHLFIFSVHIWASRTRDSFGNNDARRVFEAVHCHKQKVDVADSVLIKTASSWGILWAQWVVSSGETKVKNHFCILCFCNKATDHRAAGSRRSSLRARPCASVFLWMEIVLVLKPEWARKQPDCKLIMNNLNIYVLWSDQHHDFLFWWLNIVI